MLKESVYKMTGNEQYEGFAIDIIREISKMLGFNYTFLVQTDNVYGSYNAVTGWNGMLKRIMEYVSFQNNLSLIRIIESISSNRNQNSNILFYRKPILPSLISP